MSILKQVDRQLLGDAGIELDEDTYVQIVAGMGASFIHAASEGNGTDNFIGWSPNNFLNELEKIQQSLSPQSELNAFSERWHKHLSELPEKRVVIEGDKNGYNPDLASIVRILNHPAVQADSAFISKTIKQADLRWQWPLRIGGFEDDLAGLNLYALGVKALSREESRYEIIVMQGGVRDSLQRILALPYHMRACHIILFGPVDITWHEMNSHVESLLFETQAGALSLVSCPLQDAAQKLKTFIGELSLNNSYDLALAKAFPRESSIQLLDLRLLKEASLKIVVQDIGRSMPKMSRMVKMAVPEEALRSVNIKKLKTEPCSIKAVPDDFSFSDKTMAAPADVSSSIKPPSPAELNKIVNAELSASHEEAQSEVPRFLQGDLFKIEKGNAVPEVRGFIVGQSYRLEIFIGPGGKGTITADESFDDKQLDWKKKRSYTLQVMFAEPGQWNEPLTGKLVLHKDGVSTKCPLLFTPARPGSFSGRVTIYYRGRILQTALLKSTVFDSEAALSAVKNPEPLSFKVESEIRRSLGTLDERRRFDACMVLNKTSEGKPAATTGGKDGAFIFDLSTVADQLAAINSLMNDVANDAPHYAKGLMSKENAELLCNLAIEGNWIYRNLVLDFVYKSSAAKALRDAEYLQIVSTRPDEPVPLEFVYDYPPPKKGAPVCKNALQALKTGKCSENCKSQKSPATYVCPLGFWGLSRVIERHPIDSTVLDIANAQAVIKSEPVAGRDILSLKGPILVAASKQVPAAAQTALKKSIKKVWKDKVIPVKKWEEWVKAVQDNKPVMLLALPHNAGSGSHISLEIGNDTLESTYIDDSYVKANPQDNGPLVILFGCDMAGVADTAAYARHVTVFRQADAALVLGTVGTVLGVDAAKVSAEIVSQLVATSDNSTERFGEVLRQVKREAVANSQMLALCLVAFGDADWRLK